MSNNRTAFKRKTVDVDSFLNWANERLAQSDFSKLEKQPGAGFRLGICTVIEKILLDCNRYDGYRFINKSEAINEDAWGLDVSNGVEFHDETRRQYSIRD